MQELTQTQINDLLAKHLALQWLSQKRSISQHAKTPEADKLARGLRVLQLESRLGTVEENNELYYYLRTEFQAACVRALPTLVKNAEKFVGKPLTMGNAVQLSLQYQDEIHKLWPSSTHRAHAFAALLPYVQDSVPFQLVELPGPDMVCALVHLTEIPKVEEGPFEGINKTYTLTRENGWNEPLVLQAVACA